MNAVRQAALPLALVLSAGALFERRAAELPSTPPADLQQAVSHLTAELQQLRLERQMPALILNRSSASICYLYAEYTFTHASHLTRPMKIHVSGTGFVVADGWIATNRHVAEPWWGDSHMESLRHSGNAMRLERLLAFFPGTSSPLLLQHVSVSSDSDLAIAHFDPDVAKKAGVMLKPLPLADRAPQPGDAVLVLGYPMGVEAMLAKSPRGVARQLSLQQDDFLAARRLASLALIRPSATQGHLGDVVADKLLYDASTAQGASGSPVFNAAGEVIGVNTAYLDGFSGGGLGVRVEKLKPLLQKMQNAKFKMQN